MMQTNSGAQQELAVVVGATGAFGQAIVSRLAAAGLNCSGADLTAHMLHDKKMDAGTLPFVLLNGIGAAFLAKDVALDDVSAFLDRELQRQA